MSFTIKFSSPAKAKKFVSDSKKGRKRGGSSGGGSSSSKPKILSQSEYFSQKGLINSGGNRYQYNKYLSKVDPSNTTKYQTVSSGSNGGTKLKTVFADNSSTTIGKDKSGNPFSASSTSRNTSRDFINSKNKFIDRLNQERSRTKTQEQESQKDYFSPGKVNQISIDDTSKQIQGNKPNSLQLTAKDSKEIKDFQLKQYGTVTPSFVGESNLKRLRTSLAPTLAEYKARFPSTVSAVKDNNFQSTKFNWNPVSTSLFIATQGAYSPKGFENVRKLKTKFEEFEIKGIRNKNSITQTFGSGGSTILSPFSSQQKVDKLIVTGAVSGGIALASTINPAIGYAAFVGGSAYLTSQVPKIQTKYYSQANNPVGFRETFAQDFSLVGVGILGSYGGIKTSNLIKTSYQNYRTNKMYNWETNIKKFKYESSSKTQLDRVDLKREFDFDNNKITTPKQDYTVGRFKPLRKGQVSYFDESSQWQIQLKPKNYDPLSQIQLNNKPSFNFIKDPYQTKIKFDGGITESQKYLIRSKTFNPTTTSQTKLDNFKFTSNKNKIFTTTGNEIIIKSDLGKTLFFGKKGSSGLTSQFNTQTFKNLGTNLFNKWKPTKTFENLRTNLFNEWKPTKTFIQPTTFPLLSLTGNGKSFQNNNINYSIKQSNKQKVSEIQLTPYKEKSRTLLKVNNKINQDSMIKLRYSQSQNISPKINQAQNQKPRTKTFPALKLITTPKQEPITRFTPLRTITNPFDPIKPPPSDPTPTPPFNLPNFKFNKKRKTTEKQGFNVFVKSKGKFQQVNKGFSLSKAGALSLGGSITDKTVSATFLIKPSNLKIRSSSSSFSKNSNKFKLSKFGNVIKGVEKNKFRISTAGEKSGITLKGLLSKKKKKKKSKFKYF